MPPIVSSLRVYPVKSCGGISLRSAAVGRRGIRHDRSFMLVDPAGSMMTQRTHPRMSLIGTTIDAHELAFGVPACPPVSLTGANDGQRARATVWGDEIEAFDQGDAVARPLSAFLGADCRLLRIADDAERRSPEDLADLSFADAYPFLGICDASLQSLNHRLRSPVEMRRFRPNLTFTGTDAFAEDAWKRVRVGGILLTGGTLCSRCTIPTVDPDSGERGQEPSATLAGFRRGDALGVSAKVPHPGKVYFGRNFSHDREGTISVGDAVTVLELD